MGEDNFKIFKNQNNTMEVDSSCIFKYEHRREYIPRKQILNLYLQRAKLKYRNLYQRQYMDLALDEIYGKCLFKFFTEFSCITEKNK